MPKITKRVVDALRPDPRAKMSSAGTRAMAR